MKRLTGLRAASCGRPSTSARSLQPLGSEMSRLWGLTKGFLCYSAERCGSLAGGQMSHKCKQNGTPAVQRSRRVRLSGAPEGQPDSSPGQGRRGRRPGERATPPTSLFPSGLARFQRAKPKGKREEIILRPQPRAALRLPGAIIMTSLRDFSFARSARLSFALACYARNRPRPSADETSELKISPRDRKRKHGRLSAPARSWAAFMESSGI
jgi:hypothetical protein